MELTFSVSINIPEVFKRITTDKVLSCEQLLAIQNFIEEYESNKAHIAIDTKYKAAFHTKYRGEARIMYLTDAYEANWAMVSLDQSFGPMELQELLCKIYEEFSHFLFL